jgi:hypothetical protein
MSPCKTGARGTGRRRIPGCRIVVNRRPVIRKLAEFATKTFGTRAVVIARVVHGSCSESSSARVPGVLEG